MERLEPMAQRKLLDAMGIPVVVLRVPVLDPATDGDANRFPAHIAEPPPARPMGQDASPSSPLSALGLGIQSPLAPREAQTPVVQLESPIDRRGKSQDSQASQGGPVESPTVAPAPALAFSLVSVITPDAMVLVELPEWAGGLMDGRLRAVTSDLMRVVSTQSAEADWQYFHWPIEGLADQSSRAATDAVDAWLHRRWAEMAAPMPKILSAIVSLDAGLLTPDACRLPPLTELIDQVESKRSAWLSIQAYLIGHG